MEEGNSKMDRIVEMTTTQQLPPPIFIPQLETLKGNGRLQQLEPPAKAIEPSSTSKAEDGIDDDDEKRAIMKELRAIKRQNFITQCLLSALIVLTATWQLSEVSLILKVKDGINHPFRSFRTMLKGVLKGPNLNISQNGDNKQKKNSTNQLESAGTSVHPIRMPEIPHLDLDNDE